MYLSDCKTAFMKHVLPRLRSPVVFGRKDWNCVSYNYQCTSIIQTVYYTNYILYAQSTLVSPQTTIHCYQLHLTEHIHINCKTCRLQRYMKSQSHIFLLVEIHLHISDSLWQLIDDCCITVSTVLSRVSPCYPGWPQWWMVFKPRVNAI